MMTNALEFFKTKEQDGRAYMVPRRLWLIRVAGRLLLCRDTKVYPVIRFVHDDEKIKEVP